MDYKAKIYDSVRDENEERVFENWHASSMAICPRAHYFKRKGVPSTDEVGAGKVLRWRVGHLVEEEIRIHLENIHPEGLVSNKRFTIDELSLTGEVDNLFNKRLIEIKSVHPYAVRYLEKDNKPYLSHEYQQHAYALLTDVEEIVYVYVSLDGNMVVYETGVKPEILRAVKDRLDILNTAWETQTPPPCLCRTGSGKKNESHPLWKSQMQYCDYQTSNSCCSLALLEQHEGEDGE